MKIGNYELVEACSTCDNTRFDENGCMYCSTNNRKRVEDFILPMCPLWELNKDILWEQKEENK